VRRLLPAARAPLGLAAFLAIPIFFASLMAVSLAIEKPKVYAWGLPDGRLARTFHDPAAVLELKIWLLSFVPPLILVLIGWGACFVPRGVYITCVAAIADALLLTVRLGRWEHHHTTRFPYGEDNLSDKTNSSLTAQGQWEHNAAATAHSLIRYAVALALAAVAIALYVEVRRRRRRPPPYTFLSELQQTGSAPTVSSG